MDKRTSDYLEQSKKDYHNCDRIKIDEERTYCFGNGNASPNIPFFFNATLNDAQKKTLKPYEGKVVKIKAITMDYEMPDEQDDDIPYRGYLIKVQTTQLDKAETQHLQERQTNTPIDMDDTDQAHPPQYDNESEDDAAQPDDAEEEEEEA